MSAEGHQRTAGRETGPARCAVLTVSDTRTEADDVSGGLAVQRLRDAGHVIAAQSIVADDAARLDALLGAWLDDPGIDVIVTTGGTGLAPRDGTVEVVRTRLTRELDGFGELFRMLSHREIGAAAMLSRAVGGLVERAAGETWIFAVPGSPAAVRLALDELIVPQLPHLLWLRK